MVRAASENQSAGLSTLPPTRGTRWGLVLIGAIAVLVASLLTLWPPPGFEFAIPGGAAPERFDTSDPTEDVSPVNPDPGPPAYADQPGTSAPQTPVTASSPVDSLHAAPSEPPPTAATATPAAPTSTAATATPAANMPPPTASVDPQGAFDRGRKLEAQGKRRQAQALFESAVDHEPPHSPLLSHLAFLYLNQGKNADAAAFASRAVHADPTNSEGWIVLGAAKSELGERNAAREAYRNCAQQGRGNYVSECRRMLR